MQIENLEIGGGTLCPPGSTNLDPVHGNGQFKRRIQDGIPCIDNSVQHVRASHVFEHIPAGQERIDAFNEIWRVLVPGGTFELILPVVGFNGKLIETWEPWADPTHISFWYFPQSLLYFCEGPHKANADYGISLWAELKEEDWSVEGYGEGHALLRKPV